MIKLTLAALLAGGLLATAQAQSGGVTTSTDPAKIAAVERHAKMLKAEQHKTSTMSHDKSMAHDKSMKHGDKSKAHHHDKMAPAKK